VDIKDTSPNVVEVPKTDFEAVKATLLSYLNLGDGWDGYGGVKISPDVVESCIELLHQVNNFKLRLPETMVSGDGEVGLYWTRENLYVEIGVEEKGLYTYLILRRGYASGMDDVDIGLGLTYQLRSVLEELTRESQCSRS
jgi:hypothetical protein